jgi:UDP-2,3-diacylglucosamine hydrolase
MDVNADAVSQLFSASGASRMIHGHTHRPACHDYVMFGRQTHRWVLPAWDDAPGYLRVDADCTELINFD